MEELNSFSWSIQLTIIVRILVSAFLASLIGWERDRAGKAAGTRTMSLVGISATLIVAVGEVLNREMQWGDPTRALHAVVTGIGFLGAGLIFLGNRSIKGVTTSATVFTTAAMGVAVGLGFVWTAIAFTVVTVFILRSTQIIDRAHFRRR
jgi:putative Mg2+ transporter-C (MgtC) family protein